MLLISLFNLPRLYPSNLGHFLSILHASLLYAISCLLNALDGYGARLLNQGTQFSAVLDMVTDRCTTSCLLVFLATAIPRWAIVFQSLITLDFSSHYIHMYASLVVGGAESSHNNINKSQGWLMALKQVINVIQLVQASQRLARVDVQRR